MQGMLIFSEKRGENRNSEDSTAANGVVNYSASIHLTELPLLRLLLLDGLTLLELTLRLYILLVLFHVEDQKLPLLP